MNKPDNSIPKKPARSNMPWLALSVVEGLGPDLKKMAQAFVAAFTKTPSPPLGGTEGGRYLDFIEGPIPLTAFFSPSPLGRTEGGQDEGHHEVQS